jgi:hypothetical protein
VAAEAAATQATTADAAEAEAAGAATAEAAKAAAGSHGGHGCGASTQHGALQLDAGHQRVEYTNLPESYSKQTAHCMKRSPRRALGELVEQQLAPATVVAAFKLSKRIAAYQQMSTE